MDARSIDILRILLDHEELNYHEVVAFVRSKCRWNLSEDSTRVTVSNTLRNLVPEFLKRRDLGHKNVRYAFKNQKARQKAKSIVYTSPPELEKALLVALERLTKIENYSNVEALFEMATAFPGAILGSHFVMVIDAIIQENNADLIFNKAQAKDTVIAFWNALFRILEKQPLDQLKAGSDAIKKAGFGEPLIPPTGVLSLSKFLQRKFKTE